MNPACPGHGGDRLDFIEESEVNGFRDPPMLVCGACMDDGATPAGAWSWVLEDLPVLPFLPEFHPKVQDGRKTATARSKAYGKPGDLLQGPGCILRLEGVDRRSLGIIAEEWFREEGLDSPEQFVAIWNRIHPRKMFSPATVVFFHRFSRLTGKPPLHSRWEVRRDE